MTSDAGSATLDPRTATDDDVVLQAVNISKTYGVTRALKGVNFEVRRGKVTVLFGENGAGKSTLMKILSGCRAALAGGQLDPRRRAGAAGTSTNDAGPCGISIIHQELNLCAKSERPRQIFIGPRAGGPDPAGSTTAGEKRDHPNS